MGKSPYSKFNWPHERTKKANINKPPNYIMNEGMTGRPMAILFPFTIGGFLISTPEEWAWFKNKCKFMEDEKKEEINVT